MEKTRLLEKNIEKKELESTTKIEEKAKVTENQIPQQLLPQKPPVDEKKEYLDKHLEQIRTLINQNVKYPLKAKKLSIEGIVTVKFKINEDGTVEKKGAYEVSVASLEVANQEDNSEESKEEHQEAI